MRYAMALVTVVVAEIFVFGIAAITANEENCDNGISRWQCNGLIRDVSAALFWVLLVVLITVVLMGLGKLLSRASRSRGRASR